MQVWDIFCKVVDNYGDAGVTWRLARQLAAEHRVAPRLWIDDAAALARMGVGDGAAGGSATSAQMVQGVEIRRWAEGDVTAADAVADVVIEAFACELPAAYVQGMAARARKPLWLNLEYLSAEEWVEGTHGLASPQARVGLSKYFFFPGFAPKTGGLLRERGLLEARDAFQADTVAQAALWRALGVPPREEAPAGETRVSLFAYENPALEGLLAAMAEGAQPLRLLAPEGRVLPQVAAFFGASDARAGAQWSRGALTAHVLPFTGQPGYDRLLWACDVNFVRGEDSFVRAQWAGRPFIWQIYPQAEAAHHEKLLAFWQRYRAGMEPQALRAMLGLWRGWNGIAPADWRADWAAVQGAQGDWAQHAVRWAQGLAAQPDLAAQLVEFAAKAPNFGI
ncbi:MAG TPA: elongation factor P maturation arginine rhamnosyltransferase EarP [Burkholderiales bacterium]|jgi:uncharacterized repeat protein (TIGR03837 family)